MDGEVGVYSSSSSHRYRSVTDRQAGSRRKSALLWRDGCGAMQNEKPEPVERRISETGYNDVSRLRDGRIVDA